MNEEVETEEQKDKQVYTYLLVTEKPLEELELFGLGRVLNEFYNTPGEVMSFDANDFLNKTKGEEE